MSQSPGSIAAPSSSLGPASASQFTVVHKQPNGVCRLVLNRPKVNAFSPPFLRELISRFDELDADESVKAILLESSQASFSAGLDLQAAGAAASRSLEDGVEYLRLVAASLTSPARVSKPVAALVEGHAIAGGFVIACACDYAALSRTKDFKVGLTELKVGVPFPREALEIVRHRVRDVKGLRKFAFEGRTMSAAAAYELGFGDALEVDPRLAAMQWLEDMASLPAGIFALTKRQMNAPYFRAIGHPSPSMREATSEEEGLRERMIVMSRAFEAMKVNRPPPAPRPRL